MERIGLSKGPYLSGLQVDENTRTGSETVWTYEGTYDECVGERDLLRAAGASQIVFGPIGDGRWRVQAQFPYGEGGYEAVPAPSIHELEVEVVQESIFNSPKLRATLTEAQIGAGRRIAHDYESGVYPKVAGHTAEQDAEADVTSGPGSAALPLFRAVAYYGVDAYIKYNTVYRRTLTAATPQQARAVYEGAGKIWTTAELQTFENIAPDGWFVLPTCQWLKSPPHVVAAANQKTQITYTYTACDTALSLVYDAYGTATLFTP